MGFGVSGTVVEDAVVKIELVLPLAALLVKGMIEQRLRQDIAGMFTVTLAPGHFLSFIFPETTLCSHRRRSL